LTTKIATTAAIRTIMIVLRMPDHQLPNKVEEKKCEKSLQPNPDEEDDWVLDAEVL